jgi:hypothetical protein
MNSPTRVDLSDVPVVDGHCHPILPDPWSVSRDAFVNLFSEGVPGTMMAHIPHTGYFHRAVGAMARRLGAEPTVEAVLERRRALGVEAARRSLAESCVTALLVDTGYPPDAMPLSEMRRLLSCSVHEVFRIETCAQALLSKSLDYEGFIAAFRLELRAAAERAVAFKSIIAYRSGLAIQSWDTAAAARAYQAALARYQITGSPRLTDKPLLDTLFEVALDVSAETGRPLQVHAGFGDRDLDLPKANPFLLRPVVEDSRRYPQDLPGERFLPDAVVEDPRWAGARIVVLHMAYPYFREASIMAAVWPQVYVDLSLAIPFLGPGIIAPLIETLSLAPASKLLYGSDLGPIPDLLALSADWGRAALGEALGWLVERNGLDDAEARAVGRQVLSGNAKTLYGV